MKPPLDMPSFRHGSDTEDDPSDILKNPPKDATERLEITPASYTYPEGVVPVSDDLDDPLMRPPKLGQPLEVTTDEPLETEASGEVEAIRSEKAATDMGEKVVRQTVRITERPREAFVAPTADAQSPPKDNGQEETAQGERAVEQPGQPAEANDTPPGVAGGGNDEPPRPPEGGDGSSGEYDGDDDEAELRRLEKQVSDYHRVVMPIAGRVANLEWIQTASAEEQRYFDEIYKGAEGLAQKITKGDYKSLQEHAHKVATRLTAEGTEPGVGKAMGAHVLMSAHVINAYHDVARTDPAKVAAASDKGTYFLTQFAGALAWNLPESALESAPDPQLMYHVGRETSAPLAATMGEGKKWVDAKIDAFTSSLTIRRSTEANIKNEVTLETDNPRDLKRYNDTFAGMVDSKRQHTIKLAVHEGEGTAWTISDYQAVREYMQEAAQEADSELRPHEWSPKMRMVAIEHDPEDTETEKQVVKPGFASFGDERLSKEGQVRARVCFMDNKGELYADGDGAMPLRQAYESLGKPVNYEALRQYMLTTYFRLTVPAAVERQAQEATERVMGREANQMPQGRDPERREVVHDLLLPRISVLRSHTKQEIAQMEQAERREAEVVDRENNVVGHVRRINPAYRASQMAREEAAKYGITLPPTGMTFVAEHHHPLAGKAGTHRAKERPSGGKKMPDKP